MRAEDHARRRARAIDLLDDQGVRDGVEASAAISLRYVRAHEAERPHLAQQLRRNLALLVDLSRAREDLVCREVARRALGKLLLVGEREIEPGLRCGHRHCRIPKTRPSRSRAKKEPSRMSPTTAFSPL